VALLDRVRSLTPRQVLLPSAATAFVAVVVATAVVAIQHDDNSATFQTSAPTAEQLSNRGEPLSDFVPFEGGEAKGFSELEGTLEPEETSGANAAAGEASAPAASTPARGAVGGHRSIERSARIVLGAEPDAVAADAAAVFEAVHASQGVVLRSSVNEGAEGGAAGAHFELLIPSARLDDALGAISEIDEVLSRRDGTTDITAPTVGATERLQDSQARIDSLLSELAAAETEGERETIEGKLSSERRRAAFLGAQLATLRHRASMSHVSVRIEGSDSASGTGSWDFGDALRDAGHILAIAAGVILIGLAVLAPIALIALLVWLGRHAWVRFGRRRALG
jgi:hypothetical protein